MRTQQSSTGSPIFADHYGYLVGRRFALDALTNIASSPKESIRKLLQTLEDGCVGKPPAEARGIMDIVTMARVFGVRS